MPRKEGDRVKTDRRDAILIARSHRAGELEPIHVPDPGDEAIRDQCRARYDAKQDERRNRQRRKSFLLRVGYRYTGKSGWTPEHKAYLGEKPLPDPVQRLVAELMYGSGLRVSEGVRLRVKDLDFHYGTVIARDAKGAKDRVAPLPKSLAEPLKRQLEHVRSLHEADLSTWSARGIEWSSTGRLDGVGRRGGRMRRPRRCRPTVGLEETDALLGRVKRGLAWRGFAPCLALLQSGFPTGRFALYLFA